METLEWLVTLYAKYVAVVGGLAVIVVVVYWLAFHVVSGAKQAWQRNKRPRP